MPTVRFAGARDWATDYETPDIEELLPYSEDPRGLWLRNRTKPNRPWEWADASVTGHIIEKINERILDLAEEAAFLYWYLNDESYARFASDILQTYVNGILARAAPETFEDHSQAHILGLATFEVIHERITHPLAVTYDFLLPYLLKTGTDVVPIQDLFRRWADRIIEGGFAEGNWNLHQAKYIVRLGLALEPNETYGDGKGRQFYIDHFTKTSTPNQACLTDLVEQYDPQGVWPESPGYAFNVTDNIIQISQLIQNATGEDPLADFPILEQAALLVFQFNHANGRTVGYGDTRHNLPDMDTLELLIARAIKLSDTATATKLSAVLQDQIDNHGYLRGRRGSILELATYVGDLPEPDNALQSLSTRTFYAETVSLVIQRNGNDPQTGLMAALSGTAGGHSHAGGLALELYGNGLIVAPDSGPGVSYWQKEHSEYYRSMPAHNTVIVDGVSNYDPFRHEYPFELIGVDPVPSSDDAASLSHSYFEAAFTEPSTGAHQRRTVGLIRTSPTSGYYVDIFRSRLGDGTDRFHDYVHHNLGTSVGFRDQAGVTLRCEATDALGTHAGDQPGYDYFTKKHELESVPAVATFNLSDSENTATNLWIAPGPDRHAFSVLSPWATSTRSGSAPESLQGPMPTVIIRQKDEAWAQPFVTVIETFKKGEATVYRIEPIDTGSEQVTACTIHSRVEGAERTDIVISSTDVMNPCAFHDVVFKGGYGCVSVVDGKLQELYLGRGDRLQFGGQTLVSDGSGASRIIR